MLIFHIYTSRILHKDLSYLAIAVIHELFSSIKGNLLEIALLVIVETVSGYIIGQILLVREVLHLLGQA